MKQPDLPSALAFFSAVAYGIRRDHPAFDTARAALERAVADKTNVSALGVTVQTLADRALESASSAGDQPTVRLLLALGAGVNPNPVARPIISAYRQAVANGHDETAREMVASGLVPDWA